MKYLSDTAMNTENVDEEVKSIKPINKDTVHKICSGQVVLSLAVAVKELVENSLDAGATVIDIRLKNYGIDLVEVSDNGSGVTMDNFASLTLKYHTSKLSDYSDLLGVSSFGFRGEALSSLCALSDLVITTRHQSSPHATKIEFDHKGVITKTTPCSRQIGTTVSLCNLFSTLPVRKKEFHKNAKREFNKMTQLLYAYCLICTGVRINCTNQTASNTKSVVVATQGTNSYKDNIAAVFGTKQLQTLLEIKPHYVANIKENILKGLSGDVTETESSVNLEDVEIDLSEDSNDTENPDDTLTQSSVNSQKSTKSQGYKNVVCPVDFTGFISSCAHGSGRSSSDRQFYYINSRPCEPPKIIKLVNEIYKQYNTNQYPFVFLNINLDRTSVDVNVTPDKRKVFLTKEKLILDVTKSSLTKLFEDIPRTLKVEQISQFNGKVVNEDIKSNVDQPRIFNSFLQRFTSNISSASKGELKSDNKSTSNTELKRKSTTMLNFISSKTMKVDKSKEKDKLEDSVLNDNENVEKKEDLQNEFMSKNRDAVETAEKNTINDYENEVQKEDLQSKSAIRIEEKNIINLDINDIEIDVKLEDTIEDKINELKDIDNNIDISKKDYAKPIEEEKGEIMFLEYTDDAPKTQIRKLEDVVIEKSHTIYCKTNTPKNSPAKRNAIAIRKVNKPVVTDKEDLGKYNRKTIQLKTSLEHVKALSDIYNNQKKKSGPEKVKFRSTINPVFNKKCEEELSKEISKESFKKMTIIGQFNLGFIITQLDDDLFIIDQHATDEIYNFETLQKTTELTNQKLVIPQQLELTGVNEQILMDNLEVFKKNGFTFEIDENALPTKRVKLLTIPMSKNWIFGKEDIEELLFMLRESASEHCRPSRVRAMFASRACRKSVMIGTALAKCDMKKLVEHMAEIDKPWNCPHGRPTIRHLVNLAMVQTKEDS